MLGMWPQSRAPSVEVYFRCTFSTATYLTLTHDFSSIRLGEPGGCIDSTESLAERQRRSPHGKWHSRELNP